MRRVWVAAVGLGLAAVSGCASPVQQAQPPAAPVAPFDVGELAQPAADACGMPFSAEGIETEPLAPDTVLVRATRCVSETERVPGDGEWTVRVEQEATTGLDELATALRTPSEPPRPNQICPAIGYAPIVITVTDEVGKQFYPAIPTTACGAPLKVAADAIAALPWTTVRRARVSQLRSELETASGCPSGYKAVVALVAAEGDAGAARHPLDTTPRPLRGCRFAVTPDAAVAAGRGELYGGTLVDSSTLDPDAAGELLTAIDAAPDPITRCVVPSSFVVLDEANGDSLGIVVEVDGCYRALVGSDLRQLDRDLVTRMFG